MLPFLKTMSAESTRDTLGIRLSNRALKTISRNLIVPQKLIREVDKSLVASGEFISQGCLFLEQSSWASVKQRAKSKEQRAKSKERRAKIFCSSLFALRSLLCNLRMPLDSEREWLRNEEFFKLQIRWQSGATA